MGFVARRIGHGEPFLLAFDHDADRVSPNFAWFRSGIGAACFRMIV